MLPLNNEENLQEAEDFLHYCAGQAAAAHPFPAPSVHCWPNILLIWLVYYFGKAP